MTPPSAINSAKAFRPKNLPTTRSVPPNVEAAAAVAADVGLVMLRDLTMQTRLPPNRLEKGKPSACARARMSRTMTTF